MRRVCLVVLSLLFAVPGFAVPKFVPARENPVAGEYLIVLKEGAERSSLDATMAGLSRRYGAEVLRLWETVPGGLLKMPEAAARRLAADPRVLAVEQDYLFPAFSAAPDCGQLGNPNPPPQLLITRGFPSSSQTPPWQQTIACPSPSTGNCNDNWGLDRIDQVSGLDGNYNFSLTGAGVKVYVIDGGLFAAHQDFADRHSMTGASRVTTGYNATNGSTDTSDCFSHGHGTHVSGIIGGLSSGVAKDVTLVPVRFTSCQLSETEMSRLSYLTSAFNWITLQQLNTNPVKTAVANLSSNALDWRDSIALRQAIKAMTNARVLLVQAASNESTPSGSSFLPMDACPWTLVHPEIDRRRLLVVGGTDSADARWVMLPVEPSYNGVCFSPSSGVHECGSNVGRCLDLWAPAAFVVSASKLANNGYCSLSGTSMAAPHAAGVAALFLQAHPDAPPEAAKAALIASASQVNGLSSSGFPAIDAVAGPSPTKLVSSLFTQLTGVTAVDDRILLSVPGPVQVMYSALLANDVDWDSRTLSITQIDPPTHGTVTTSGTTLTYDAGSYVGTDSFTYQVTDGLSTATGLVAVVNERPVVVDDHIAFAPDQQGNDIVIDPGSLIANDFDLDSSVTFVGFVAPPSNLAQDSGGLWHYTAPYAPGTVSVTYRITDGHGNTADGTLYLTTFTFQLGSDISKVTPDLTFTDQETPVQIYPAANDQSLGSPAGTNLTVTQVTTPKHGTAAIANNVVTYTPATGFAGYDSFTYIVSNQNNNKGAGSVTVEVRPKHVPGVNHPPVAVADVATTEHDTPITLSVLANDSDPDHDALTVTDVTQPGNGSGTAVINNGTTVTLTPTAGFSGDSVFQYTIKDSHDAPAANPATVTVHVRGANHPPTPQSDALSTPKNTPLDFTFIQLLSNDTDPDGDSLIVIGVTGLSCSGGVCHYTPPAGFTGSVGPFNYTVSDGRPNGTAQSTVTITVFNRNPVANPDAAFTAPNTAVSLDVLANDAEPDGDPLAVLAVTAQPAAGTGACTVISNATRVLYTPPAGFLGQAVCKYTATDGVAPSNETTITVTVSDNRPPIARGEQIHISSGTQTQIARATLLANDFDPDGDVLAISSFNTAGMIGTLSCPTGGTACTFTPGSGFAGVTQFSYTVTDGRGGVSTATAKLKVGVVQSLPVAHDDLLTTLRGTAKAFTILDVLANDTDADGDVLNATIISGPRTYGSVSCTTPTFNCTYTPNSGFVGVDRFSYTADDGADGSSTAFIQMVVLPPSTPTFDAQEDQLSTAQNTSRFFTRSFLTSNDYSPTGDPLTVTSFDATGLNGTLDCTSDTFGCIYYPPSYFVGTTRFKYTVSDTHGHSDTAIVKVNVGATNTAPVAANDSLATRANTPLTFSVFELLKNDVDAQNDPMTVTVYPYPSHGTLTCSTPNYWCTYTPTAGYTGADSFNYVVSDGIAASNQATVTVTVQPVLAKDAVIVLQSVPASMAVGQTYPVSLTIKNIGTVAWSLVGPQCNAFRLGAVNPYDNTTWGASRAELPTTVAANGQVTVTFNVTAPTAPGPYNFQRRMVHECVEWFGDLSPNVVVSVHP